ncbi:uncharacterized protein LOC135346807 [Halichondria panicea]|uniref:uncharacterized protein LOC135346807 n=1 Tax=Halichondria panicea TaxID=6063 RepID=UPI00312B4CAB
MALMNRSEQVMTELRHQGIDSQETSEDGTHMLWFLRSVGFTLSQCDGGLSFGDHMDMCTTRPHPSLRHTLTHTLKSSSTQAMTLKCVCRCSYKNKKSQKEKVFAAPFKTSDVPTVKTKERK